VHLPAGAGTAELLWLDLTHGWAGAEEAGKVRDWRKAATAELLLRPVFARPPRPRPADGTCRGRKADGKPCGYRAKRVDGQLTDWCGRHQDQQTQLARWLAENPDTDPAGGVELEPAREPVQPATGAAAASHEERAQLVATAPVQAAAQAWTEAQQRAEAAADQLAAELNTRLDELQPGVRETMDRAAAELEEQPAPARELQLNASPGTYALDPNTEQNGNRRPVSRFQDAAQETLAVFEARAGILRQIVAAQSETDLRLVYQSHAALWDPELTTAAGYRSRQLEEQRAREKPEAALLAAITTAPDHATLLTLHQQYGTGGLWTPECDAAASTRWNLLEQAAHLS
jgi:hypothetical protein